MKRIKNVMQILAFLMLINCLVPIVCTSTNKKDKRSIEKRTVESISRRCEAELEELLADEPVRVEPSGNETQTCDAQRDDPNIVCYAKSVGNGYGFHGQFTSFNLNEVARSFSISFDFRTYYPSGLFGFLTNSDKSFYFGIQLREGALEFVHVYLGKPIHVGFGEKLNDGHWHSVTVTKSGDSITIEYDGHTRGAVSTVETWDIQQPLYLGGPENTEDFLDSSVDLVPHSIRGCIRSLKLNGNDISDSDIGVVRDWTRCYRTEISGIHFSGQAWGVSAESFPIGTTTTITLDFLTESQSGILVSASSGQDKGITLELHEGKVKLTLKTGNGQVVSVETKAFRYSNKRWHTVVAYIESNRYGENGSPQLKLVVGGQTAVKEFSMPGPINISGYLFLGGSRHDFPQSGSVSQENFHGCMRGLVINGQVVDWYNLTFQEGLRKSGCPIF